MASLKLYHIDAWTRECFFYSPPKLPKSTQISRNFKFQTKMNFNVMFLLPYVYKVGGGERTHIDT
jgi:hypothetical protein